MRELVVAHIDFFRFLNVPYVATRHPGNTTIQAFLDFPEHGANCELFALAALRLAGFYVEEKRSIELWHDDKFTEEVEKSGLYEPFDIFFFLPKGADPHKVEDEVSQGLYSLDANELKKFHLGVYIGEVGGEKYCLLHLPKPGPSVVWPLSYFGECEKEYWLFKVKRPFIKQE